MKKNELEVKKIGHTFSEKGHIHKLGDKRLTGVTTVLGILDKPFLLPWVAKMAIEWLRKNPGDEEGAKKAWTVKRDTAGVKGTDIHAQVEELINNAIQFSGGLILSGKSESKQIQFFLNWAIGKKVKFLASEKLVHSKELFIGGICDFICEIPSTGGTDGQRYIGDIKTGKVIEPTYFWQTSAYDYCLNEMGEGLAGKYVILRLGKDEVDEKGVLVREGTFEIRENYAYEDCIDGFKSLLNVYRKLKAIGK